MMSDQALLIVSISGSILAALFIGYLLWTRTGERPQIEASLELLNREIRDWTRRRKGEPEEEPLLLQMLHAVNPIARKMVSPKSLVDIENQIVRAGNPRVWTLANILSMKVYSVIGGLLVGVLFAQGSGSGIWFAVGIAVVGYELPDLVIRQMANTRQDALRRELPDTLDLLTVTVEAGLGFDAAVSHVVAGSDGPAASELSRYLQEKQIGTSSSAALDSLAARTTVGELKAFAAALQQAEKLGISLGAVLRELTREMRVQRRQHAEEEAQKVPVKILGPMMLFIFPVILIVMVGPAVIPLLSGGLGG